MLFIHLCICLNKVIPNYLLQYILFTKVILATGMKVTYNKTQYKTMHVSPSHSFKNTIGNCKLIFHAFLAVYFATSLFVHDNVSKLETFICTKQITYL